MRIKIQIRMERANALRLALAFLRNAHTNRSTRLIPGIRSRNSVQKKLEVFRAFGVLPSGGYTPPPASFPDSASFCCSNPPPLA